jgi:glycosyltransferase involved in cell wall biosynthesis
MNAGQGPQLSWVLPLYRTRAQLPELLARVHAASEALLESWEVVLVDDACPEGSGDAAEALLRQHPRARLLRLPRNLGQDRALRAGLAQARGEWALILDADLQDPPEAVAALWQRKNASLDALFVQRTGRYTSAGRQLTSRLYRSAIAFVGRLPPGACLFALLPRRTIDALCARADADPTLLALIAALGRRFDSLPVTRAKRGDGRSAYSSLDRLRKATRSLWQMLSYRRLHRRVPHPPSP